MDGTKAPERGLWALEEPQALPVSQEEAEEEEVLAPRLSLQLPIAPAGPVRLGERGQPGSQFLDSLFRFPLNKVPGRLATSEHKTVD